MYIESKMENPIAIKIGDNENVILADEKNKISHSLRPGAVFGGIHYGFVLIIDKNGNQKEIEYPTQCIIDGVWLENNNNTLIVIERGKSNPWIFSYYGELKQEASYDPNSYRDRASVYDLYGYPFAAAVKKFKLKVKAKVKD